MLSWMYLTNLFEPLGIIKSINPWGKRRLAYSIQKKNYGSYVEIEFTANSRLNIPKIIENEYRINDRVLRYLTYVVTKKELVQREIDVSRIQEIGVDQAENNENRPSVKSSAEDNLEKINDAEKSSDNENLEVGDEEETKKSE